MPFDQAGFVSPQDTEGTRVLAHVEKLLSKPRRWTKYITTSTWWWRRRYCAMGAHLHAIAALRSGPEAAQQSFQCLQTAATIHGYDNIAMLNDSPITTHAFILEVIREAKALSRTG